MKKVIFTAAFIVTTIAAMAQQHLAFPFQGGNNVYNKFFKDSLVVSPEIVKAKAAGTAVFKFTSDDKGTITKIIVYYADDAILAKPIIDVLRKSNKKWVIPDGHKAHDFILPFSISFNAPPATDNTTQAEFYKYFLSRRPIVAYDQVPLDEATLLPAINIKYDIGE